MSVNPIEPSRFLFEDDGNVPNNPKLPLLFYAGAFDRNAVSADLIEGTFHANKWGNNWRSTVFSFPHYHAEAHEALGCYRGTATIRLGGENGIEQRVQPGDVVVIPAGVGHQNLGSSTDFTMVGAYPPGQCPDLQRGEPSERPWALESIAKVPLPPADPVFGKDGPLNQLWTDMQFT
ncbi:MAG: cupin domain-containing protein [Opitutales bacterium]